ncbi:tRNA-Thr(GGU) m(6)t(6)A37 methyltransferase TsaA [Desulfotomaculum arcticum]|uniref:tRNA-Thr(GGU) m(6)t(6)A37 methyltransferase TsaA n=1 Tax=Desulfotruncus arcticus DSM 17038 TaxID=1121424 RepID=A0A1I2PL59_9FIRM|nr:tRNA-Thr(GGU) m(6)t(6)A37 methyltransferase TsaA [Desulfotomaculum arcticum] [Desulfotruncus arcticus DSM 17038]
MELVQIGVIHSPYLERSAAPRQERLSEEIMTLEIYPAYVNGLKDIEQVSHLIVLYWCDRTQRDTLQTVPPSGTDLRGVFACRSPSRPNPIAFCVAELLGRENNHLRVRGLDALDGSPLLDIKPYASAIDSITGARIGWQEK